jgi:hypothetical protein
MKLKKLNYNVRNIKTIDRGGTWLEPTYSSSLWLPRGLANNTESAIVVIQTNFLP